MTNTSFTAMQAMVSTPLARIWSASCTKPGRCLASQVGVKAPGTENSTTVLPLKSSSVERSLGPSLVIRLSVPAGMRSPALIAMRDSFASWWFLGLLRVQLPKAREPLEGRVTLHQLEGLHRVVLVAALQLRDAEQQAVLGLALGDALGERLVQLLGCLVVLLVAEVGTARGRILVALGRGIGLLRELAERALVGRGALLGGIQQALRAILGALVVEQVAVEAAPHDFLRLTRGAGIEQQPRHLLVVTRLLQHVGIEHEPVGLEQVRLVTRGLAAHAE